MASSKARSRNTSARQARSAGGRPAARTSTQKPEAQKPEAQKPEAQKPEAQKPQAASPRGAASTRAKQQAAVAAAAPAPARPTGPPLWFQIVTLVLAVLGLAVSAYETWAHFNGSQLAGCPSGGHGTFNCGAVITSPQSMVFGVFPVAILGLIFYVVVTALMTPWAWRMQRREVGLLRLAAVIVGMGFAMYLIYAEVVQIQQICEYCTGVHVITFLLFCLTVMGAAVWGLGKPAAKAKAA
jgi:uncharacterized membrane protein